MHKPPSLDAALANKVPAPQQTSFPRWSGPSPSWWKENVAGLPADLADYGLADQSADPFRFAHEAESFLWHIFIFDADFSFRARDRVCLLNSIVGDNPIPS